MLGPLALLFLLVVDAGWPGRDVKADALQTKPCEWRSTAQTREATRLFGHRPKYSHALVSATPSPTPSLGPQGFNISGARASENLGISMSEAGDVNGDGLSDVLVCGGISPGACYIVFGKTSGDTVKLSGLGSQGFAVTVGTGVLSAPLGARGGADVNGDGFDDFVVANSTTSFVVLGRSSAAAVTMGDASRGFVIRPFSGCSSAALAGDFNGDGLAECLVTCRVSGKGVTYVVFGTASPSTVSLITMPPVQGFNISWTSDYLSSEPAAAALGDVNGDGLADIGITDPDGFNWCGAVYVVFGRRSLFQIDLTNLGAGGYVIVGPFVEAMLGKTDLFVAGDVNGDGLADVGASVYGAPSSLARVAVVCGQNSTAQVDMSSPWNGWRLDIAYEVFVGGDISGDGVDDLLLGCPNPAVVYGARTNGLSVASSCSTFLYGGFRVTQACTNCPLSAVGDVNGDGRDDFVVSRTTATAEFYQSGVAYVVFGKDSALPVNLDILAFAVPSFSPSITPAPTPSMSRTRSVTATSTVTPSGTATSSVTPTVSRTPSVTTTVTRTPSVSSTATLSPSGTPTMTPSPPATRSATRTPTPTPSVTPSPASLSPSSTPESLSRSPETLSSTTTPTTSETAAPRDRACVRVAWVVSVFAVSPTTTPTTSSQPSTSVFPVGAGADAVSAAPSGLSSGTQVGAIVGGTLGSVACSCCLFAIVMYFLRRRRTTNNKIGGGGSGAGQTLNLTPLGPTQVTHWWASTQRSGFGFSEGMMQELAWKEVDPSGAMAADSDSGGPITQAFVVDMLQLFASGGQSDTLFNAFSPTRFELIRNDYVQRIFNDRLKALDQRRGAGLSPQTSFTDDQEEVIERLKGRFLQPSVGVTANVVLMWHGCSHQAAKSIGVHGAIDLRRTDGGYFGVGVYVTPHSSYAVQYSMGALSPPDVAPPAPNDKGEHVIVLCAVAVGVAYPVTRDDYQGSPCSVFHFRGVTGKGPRSDKALLAGYDAHYVGVKVVHDFQSAFPGEEPDYEELVVNESQVLPLCRVYFK